MVNRKLRSFITAVFLTTVLSVGLTSGQAQQTAPVTNDPLYALPASDVVGFVDVRRIITEIIPRVFASDPAMLGKMMAVVNETKTKTGINLLSIERIVVGVRLLGPLFPTAPKDSLGVVVIVRGDSHASAVIEFLKRETKGKFAQETYGGKVVYSEPPPTPPSKRTERSTPAMAMLDANTIAVGDLPQVRAAIDAFDGKERVDSALVALATRDSSALLGSAMTIPDGLKQSLNERAPQDEMTQGMLKLLNGIKQTYLSIGATATDYNAIFGARIETPEQAQSLGDMLLGLRQQASSFIPDPKIRTLVDTLQITAEGDQVQLRADVKSDLVQEFIGSMMKEMEKKDSPPPAVTKSAPAKAKKTTRSRRGRRRARTH